MSDIVNENWKIGEYAQTTMGGWEILSVSGDRLLVVGRAMDRADGGGRERARVIAASTVLLRELEKNRETLIDLRDKHLNHAAAVVRALLQHRIEAAELAIAQAKGGL